MTDFASQILEEKAEPKDFAAEVLGARVKNVEIEPPSTPKGLYSSDIPVLDAIGKVLPSPKTWEQSLEERGLDPSSPTLGEDLLQSMNPLTQRDYLTIGVGRGLIDRWEGLQQLGLEMKMIYNAGRRMITGEMADTAATKKAVTKEQRELGEFSEEALKERREYGQSRVGKTSSAKAGRVVGGVAPLLAIPAPGGPVVGSGLIGGVERGTAFLPPGESRLREAGKGVAMGFGVGLGAKAVTSAANIATGRGMFQEGKGPFKISKDKAELVRKVRESDLGLDPLFLHQELGNHPILNRLASQAGSSSTTFREALESQLVSGSKTIKAIQKELSESAESSGNILLTEARKGYQKALSDIERKTGEVDMRGAGNALREGIKSDYIKTSQQEVRALYAEVDAQAAKEAPVFDLSSSQSKAELFRGGKAAIGREGEDILVSGARGEYRLILDDYLALRETQPGYEAIKSIRTRLGDVIERHPPGSPAGEVGGEAKYLYRLISKELNQPVNSAPNFVKAHTEASAKSLERFEVIGDSDIQKIMATGNEFQIAQMLSKPGGISDNVLKAMEKIDPERMNTIREFTRANILLDEQGAQAALANWLSQFGDRKGIIFFLGNGNKQLAKTQLNELQILAQRIDTLRLGPVGDMAKLQISQQVKARQALSVLISERTTPSDIKLFIETIGGKQSVGYKSFIASVYEDFVSRATKKTESGLETIDRAALQKSINQYKNSGVWDELRPIDRSRIEALDAYYSMLVHGGRDVGSSLEVAQAITNLKHPATFITGVHQLGVNSVMGRILSSDSLANVVLGKGKQAWKVMPETKRISAVVNAYLDEISPPETK